MRWSDLMLCVIVGFVTPNGLTPGARAGDTDSEKWKAAEPSVRGIADAGVISKGDVAKGSVVVIEVMEGFKGAKFAIARQLIVKEEGIFGESKSFDGPDGGKTLKYTVQKAGKIRMCTWTNPGGNTPAKSIKDKNGKTYIEFSSSDGESLKIAVSIENR